MLYALEQGKTEEAIIDMARRNRQELPTKIMNAPFLLMGLETFYEAFWDLTSCRQVGMGEGPIPWTAVKEYADEHEFYGEVREDLFYHVKKMDVVYLNHSAKALSSGSKSKSQPTPIRQGNVSSG